MPGSRTARTVNISKFINWQAALDLYIAEAHQRYFSYDCALGLDCCTFTWGAIEAQTGVVVGEQFRGAYRTRREARALMKMYCGRPSLALAIHQLMAEHGFAQLAGAYYAQRGDAVLCPNGNDHFLGIVDLNGRDVLGVGDHGVRRVQISVQCHAWRID